MELRVSCACGRTLTVTEGSADVTIQCACGEGFRVPPFRRAAIDFAQHFESLGNDAYPPELLALFIVGIAVLVSVSLGGILVSFTFGGIAGLGYSLAVAGQMWLLLLIGWNCHPEAILWSLLVPFFTWYFAWKRRDIAKWAFLCNAGGLILFFSTVLGRL